MTGIINAFKTQYRTQIVRCRIDAIEYSGDDEDTAIPVLDAINFINSAWNTTSNSKIQNCYHKNLKPIQIQQKNLNPSIKTQLENNMNPHGPNST